MNHEAEIRKFIVEKFLFGEQAELGSNTQLLDTGIMDSTGVLELIDHIEKRYGIKVNDDELVAENLDSIGNICTFLNRKIAEDSVGPDHHE
jgi:acyl carrier protein